MGLLAIQSNKVLKLSCDATRVSTDNLHIKAGLAAKNHPFWILTLGPFILKKDKKVTSKSLNVQTPTQ